MKETIFVSLSFVILITSFVFSSSKDKGYFNVPEQIQETKKDSVFELGETLFKDNCTACHYIGMDKVSTAPALGGVTERRNRKWLYSFTRNSWQMIKDGDSLAVALFENYHQSPMTSSPHLSDADLDALYHFIDRRYDMTKNGIPVPVAFKFKLSENNRAKACSHVLSKERDILSVSVSQRRFWTFSCAVESHPRTDWTRTTLKTLFKIDPSINETSYLTNTHLARRTAKDSPWDYLID